MASPARQRRNVRRIAGLVALGKERRMIPERLRLEDVPHLRRRQSWLPYTVGFGSLFGSRGGLYNNAESVELDGENVLQADGDDVLLFRFEVPPEAEHISFRVLAANDYAIDLGAPVGRSGVVGSVWEDWRNVVRGSGQHPQRVRIWDGLSSTTASPRAWSSTVPISNWTCSASKCAATSIPAPSTSSFPFNKADGTSGL